MKINFNFPEKFNLSSLPTPIIPTKNFFTDFNEYNVWLKRDDLTGLEISGNKIRKLEYIVKKAVNEEANHLITCGGLQSNHCRTVAFIAAKLGLNCTLFLRGQPTENEEGNYLLNSILGVNIKIVTAEEYLNIDVIMDEYASKIRTQNEKPYVIPEGGSNDYGVWGYIECFIEIENQIKEQQLPIHTIVVPTGSGGTHAGLLLGKLLTKSSLNVVSFNVCETSDFFKTKIASIVGSFANKNNLSLKVDFSDINIIDGYVGEGYGMITGKETDLIKRFATDEGIIIDPVYTAKALLGLEDKIRSGTFEEKNVLFIHTGGIFGIFGSSSKFLKG